MSIFKETTALLYYSLSLFEQINHLDSTIKQADRRNSFGEATSFDQDPNMPETKQHNPRKIMKIKMQIEIQNAWLFLNARPKSHPDLNCAYALSVSDSLSGEMTNTHS